MRTLHIVNTLAPGGAQSVLTQLIENWGVDQKRQMVISLRKPEQLSARVEALGVHVEHLNLLPGEINPAKFIKLVRIIRAYQPDVVQTWLYHSDLIGGIAAKLAGHSHIVWGVHHTTEDIRSLKKSTATVVRMLTLLSRWIPSRIICCSQSAHRTHLALGYLKEKLIVIPNGIDTNLFRPDPSAAAMLMDETGIASNSKRIGMFARYHPQKDFPTFIRAAEILLSGMPDVHFVLAGEGITESNGQLQNQIIDAGIQNNIHLLGSRHDMPALTAGMDMVTLSSSHGEALPLTIGEAMACSVPCVATDVGDTGMLIGNTGRVVEPGNPQALADAWEYILNLSNKKYKELGSRARARVVEFYNVKTMTGSYKTVYREVNNIR